MTLSFTPSVMGLSWVMPDLRSGTAPGVALLRNASATASHCRRLFQVLSTASPHSRLCQGAGFLNSDDGLAYPEGEVRSMDEESWTGIVDVGSKPVVSREAIATGLLILSEEGIDVVATGRSPKGDVMASSTVAAIQAGTETPRALPRGHPIPIEGCTVDWGVEENGLRCTVSVRTHWTTGVEMEALCGVNAGLLCAWEMLKPIEKDAQGQYPTSRMEGIRVLRKSKGDPHD